MGNFNFKSKSKHEVKDIASDTLSVAGLQSVLRGFTFDDSIINACLNLPIGVNQTFVTAGPGQRTQIEIKKLIYDNDEVVNFKIVQFDKRR